MNLPCQCLTCKASVTVKFHPFAGMPIYHLVAPQGWLIVFESGQPFTLFCLCPECKRAFGPIPSDVVKPSPTVSVHP